VKAMLVEDADVVTYVVVCDPGDEAVAALSELRKVMRPDIGIALIDLDRSES
jgi:hypothetical protein